MDAKKIVGAIISTILRLGIAIFVLYFIYEAAISAYNFGYRIFADLPCALSPGRDIEVTITESMGAKEMAEKFEEVGLVEDWKLFFVQIKLSEYKDDLKPGIYTLNNSMNSEELLGAMAAESEESEADVDSADVVDIPEDISDSEVVPGDEWYDEVGAEGDYAVEGAEGEENAAE